MGGRFRHLLEPILRTSRSLGLFPLGRGFNRSKSHVLVSFFWISSLHAAVVAIIWMTVYKESRKTEKHRMILIFKMVLLSLVPVVNLFRLLSSFEDFKSIISRIAYAERVLTRTNIGVIYNTKNIFRYAVLRFIFEFLFETIRLFAGNFGVADRILRSIFFFVGMIMTQMIQLQLYCFLEIFGKLMYSFLEFIERPAVLKELHVVSVLEAQNRIEIASFDLNKIYSLQILFIVIYRYLSFLSSTYEALVGVTDYLKDETNLLNFLELIMDIAWLLYALLDLLLLAYNCTSVTNAAENVNKGLYKLILYSKKKELLISSKLRLHFVNGNKIEFSACELFPLDYSLVHSVITHITTFSSVLASTLTFLVILMQMG